MLPFTRVRLCFSWVLQFPAYFRGWWTHTCWHALCIPQLDGGLPIIKVSTFKSIGLICLPISLANRICYVPSPTLTAPHGTLLIFIWVSSRILNAVRWHLWFIYPCPLLYFRIGFLYPPFVFKTSPWSASFVRSYSWPGTPSLQLAPRNA